MIFSIDLCPLCGKKLQIQYLKDGHYRYHCSKIIIVRGEYGYGYMGTPHYIHSNQLLTNTSYAEMVIKKYHIHHNSKIGTVVYKDMGKEGRQELFNSSLLDLDYSNTDAFLTKMKLLVLFS